MTTNIGDCIRVASVNCRGIQSVKKRNDVLHYLKNKNFQILCLQDTHWTRENLREIYPLWNRECILNGTKTNSRGVAILFGPDIEYKIEHTYMDDNGNMICLDLLISNDFSVRLINIYAPNSDEPNFFRRIHSLVQDNTSDYIIITGDYNLSLDQKMDTQNYLHLNNPKARDEVLKIMLDFDLIDTFRKFHPTDKKFTWYKKTPYKSARLDYFLVNNPLLDIITKTSILPGYRTDHSLITLDIIINKFTRGPGIWKLNCSLLTNPDYIILINRIIDEEKKKYAVPVYNLHYLNTILDSEIQFTVDPKTFLEMLLLRIRGQTISFSSKLKRKKIDTEETLIGQIESLQNQNNICLNDSALEEKKEQLQELRNEKLKGQLIRSRAQWLNEGEKPTKFFCSLANKNYVNKTIKKLNISNTTITDQVQILKQVKQFYKNLFENKDDELNDFDPTQLNFTNDLRKLSDHDKNTLNTPITLDEISESLKKMKNNRSPGLDGYPAEFYKLFWVKLKHYVFKAINQVYKSKELSLTMKQCVITCIPKGDKPREYLKNWRPISLLNVTYKLASSTIASRLKKSLPTIISKTQTGFLPETYIGESTRLIYDIMHITEQHKIPGLLMLIDFEKAFDSISWNFLTKTLQFFNFGDYIINWVNILNTDIKSTIVQSGFLSEFFPINRGCRQGDPIASYEFLVCAQILYLMIQNNIEIKGIYIKNQQYKLTQFADDTTLILNGSLKSLQAALNTLEIYGSFSGLKINKDKTKLVWIGKKKHCKDKLATTPPLNWGSTQFELLGILFHVDLNKMITLNYYKYNKQIHNLINHWNKRYLTPIGKVTVIKTYIISKLIHLFSSLPNPPKADIDHLNKTIFNFLWSNKPDKIKRNLITQSYPNGGIKMINIKDFMTSLKISWVRRLLSHNSQPWVTLVNSTILPISNISKFGSYYFTLLLPKITNSFWKDTFQAWIHYCDLRKPITTIQALKTPVWYNPRLTVSPLYIKQWQEKGILTIADIIDSSYQMLTIGQIIEKYQVSQIDFLTEHRFINSIKTFIKNYIQHDHRAPVTYQTPTIPFHIESLILHKKGVKQIYTTLQIKNYRPYSSEKWNRDLQLTIDPATWRSIFKSCFRSITDNYLIWHQYKLITRILGTKYLLHKMKLCLSPACGLCSESDETLVHLYIECKMTKQIWNDLEKWIYEKLNIRFYFNQNIIILGYLNTDNYNIPINTVLMVTKSYIFTCSRKNRQPHIHHLLKQIKDTYNDQKLIAACNDKLDNFWRAWKNWKRLFN